MNRLYGKHLPVPSRQHKNQKNGCNMFEVKTKDARMTLLMLLSWSLLTLEHTSHLFVFIVNFEQVNVSWVKVYKMILFLIEAEVHSCSAKYLEKQSPKGVL